MLEAMELRPMSPVSVVHEATEGTRVAMTVPSFAFLDYEDRVEVQVQVPLTAEWHVYVNSNGFAMAHWRGEHDDAPGMAEWRALAPLERLMEFMDGDGSTPGDITLDCHPVSFDGVVAWEVCLFPLQLNLGHLIVPCLTAPSLESL